MNANELADAMEIRASIRRKATSRKSVTEGANDRLADQLDQAATMLRQQQAEIEALKANRKHDFGLGEASGFIKGHKENPYKAITNTKIEPTVVSYTHPYKPSKSEVDALLDNADYVVGIMRKEIEEWKRKYKDMHNLATQAMSKVHQLEKEAQEK